MDTLVWLLESGVEPEQVNWICPRDSWLINRDTTQPGRRFAKQGVGRFIAQLEAIPDAGTVDELFERFEEVGAMLRIDPSVRPTMFHYATISRGEVEQIRRIKQVIRDDRVERIAVDKLVMASGSAMPAAPDTLYIDCSATAVEFRGDRTMPVFDGDRITLQALLAPLVTTSAAIIAYVEAHVADVEEQNRLCPPVPLADNPYEWIVSFLGNMQNQGSWSKHPGLREWFANCRLNPNRRMPEDGPSDDDAAAASSAIRERMGQAMGPAMEGLKRLLAAEQANWPSR